MINVLNYKYGIQLVKNVIVQLQVNKFFQMNQLRFNTKNKNLFLIFFSAAYYRGAMGFILMYDITNEESFNAVQDW